jgi:hypothetical protein
VPRRIHQRRDCDSRDIFVEGGALRLLPKIQGKMPRCADGLAPGGRHKACPHARCVIEILPLVEADRDGIDSKMAWNSRELKLYKLVTAAE